MGQYCRGCGGLLGRDCYNEADCIQISQQMMYQENETIFLLQQENEMLRQLLIQNNISIPAKEPVIIDNDISGLPF